MALDRDPNRLDPTGVDPRVDPDPMARPYDPATSTTTPGVSTTPISRRHGGSNWAWILAGIVVIAAVFGFFFWDATPQNPDVPATGSISRPADPAPSTGTAPAPATPSTPSTPNNAAPAPANPQ